MNRRAIVVICIASTLLLACTGCQWIREKFNLAYTVTDPEKESREWVIQQVLIAAGTEPFEEAWLTYSQYLHSEEANSPQAVKEWEQLRFPALRRKHVCYLRPDEGNPYAYEVKETVVVREDYYQLRVSCKTSDMPTPCHLVRDPEDGGKWRIRFNCLN